MKYGLLICAMAFALGLQSCADPGQQRRAFVAPAYSDNLAVVIADVQSADARARDGDASGIRALPHNIEVLTRAIDGGAVQGDALNSLRYTRGVARQLLNRYNEIIGLPIDRAMAEAAVADFLAVADATRDDNSASGLRANAIYFAGNVTGAHLGDNPKANEYYRQCAAMKQAGCQNVMAAALLTGQDGVAQDLNASLALHKEVYDTGITYTCAGTYSARSIAFITHFTNAKLDDRSGLDWLRRAIGLSDQVKARAGGMDMCNGAGLRIDEYMMRLEAGQKDEGLVDFLRSEDALLRPFAADYLLGKSNDRVFLSELRKLDDVSLQCSYAFFGAWKASINGNKSAARDFRAVIVSDREDIVCAIYSVYSERLVR